MAKTFDPNRVLPGTIELVRDANGNYTTKVVGLESINSLSLPEISDTAAVTKTDTDTKTATDITGDTIQKQTQMAFKTPDRDDDPFTTEKMLTSAKDLSRNLSDFNPDTAREQFARQAILPGTFDADTFDDAVGTRIKDPTESVFGRSTLEDEQRERQTILPDLNVGKKTDRVTSSDVQLGKAEPPGLFGFKFDRPIQKEDFLGDKFKTEKTSEVTQAGMPTDIERRQQNQLGSLGISTPTDVERRQQRQLGMTDEERRQQFQLGSLGISADPSKTSADPSKTSASFGTSVDNIQGFTDKEDFISTPAKKTFIDSVNTALKGVGEAVSKLPAMQFISSFGRTMNESASTVAFNKGKFNIVTSSGPMQGRIVGDDGTYDPQNNLFHGMNRTSAFGNLEKAGQKRIDKIKANLAKGKYRNPEAQQAKVDKFEKELDDYRRGKNDHNIKSAKKKGVDTTKLNPNEMRNVAETGNAEGNTSSKIVCTMMNQSYGFGSFRNKIWMKFHGNIAPEYQKGYHKLFLPLVNYAKQKGITNKIIKNILEHIAVHSTIDMRQTLRGKRHTLGRLYRKVILPLCYWAGKK